MGHDFELLWDLYREDNELTLYIITYKPYPQQFTIADTDFIYQYRFVVL